MGYFTKQQILSCIETREGAYIIHGMESGEHKGAILKDHEDADKVCLDDKILNVDEIYEISFTPAPLLK